MKKNKLLVFLIISLAFNLAVLGVFAFHRFSGESSESISEDPAHCDPHLCRRFARDFGLPHASAERFATEMGRYREEEKGLRRRIGNSRMQLMSLFNDKKPDSVAIEEKVEEIAGLQEELEKIMIRRLLRVNSVLSDSERVRFNRILMRRMCGERPHHPPFIGRGGRDEEL